MKGTVVRSPSRRLLPSLALRATPLLSTLTLGSATIASDLRARLRCAPLRKRSGHATEGESLVPRASAFGCGRNMREDATNISEAHW
jgi:hypothetical protein